MSVTVTPATEVTATEFNSAVESLRTVRTRREILLETLPAPARLAPHSFALSATVAVGDEELGSGRLVLLHDPAGVDAWDGTLRIVVFATCILDGEMAGDPMLPEVAWSWLVDSLQDAPHTALGGTVTATRSTRFGDITGPENADDLEIRASWTPRDADLTHHLDAYLALLAAAAGLPPEGVSPLRVNDRSNDG